MHWRSVHARQHHVHVHHGVPHRVNGLAHKTQQRLIRHALGTNTTGRILSGAITKHDGSIMSHSRTGSLSNSTRSTLKNISTNPMNTTGCTTTTTSNGDVATTTGRNYGCPQCPASFRRGSDRNRHMRMVHAKIRPFECGLCGNHFGRKSFLDAHVLTVHQKLRPFRCDCGAAFGQRSSLTRHARKLHAGTSNG